MNSSHRWPSLNLKWISIKWYEKCYRRWCYGSGSDYGVSTWKEPRHLKLKFVHSPSNFIKNQNKAVKLNRFMRWFEYCEHSNWCRSNFANILYVCVFSVVMEENSKFYLKWDLMLFFFQFLSKCPLSEHLDLEIIEKCWSPSIKLKVLYPIIECFDLDWNRRQCRPMQALNDGNGSLNGLNYRLSTIQNYIYLINRNWYSFLFR